MKVQNNNVVHKHPAHPWVTASCVIFGLGLLAAAVFWIRKCKSSTIPKHEYSALRLENCTDLSILDKQIRNGAFASCQNHLAISNRYDLKCNVGEIGSRPDKQWFIVKDKSLGAERLLTLIPIPSESAIKASAATRETLLELFRSLQHPYIYPILDIEFWENAGLALISPLNSCKSLKDLIHDELWHEFYDKKYTGRGEALPIRQIQCLGRQILEALLFLHNRNFPKFYHLHAGNVIIQHGVARLAGLENSLLALAPKPPAVNDSLAFGYLLYEMTTGYELGGPPNPSHLHRELQRTPKIADAILTIFENGKPPSIEELLYHELFRGVELRELRRTTGISYTTSADVNDFLEMVQSSIKPTPCRSDVEMIETRKLEEYVEEQLDIVEKETITVVIETREIR